MTLSSNIGNHAILSSDIYLGVSSMNQMINQNQFLTENSYTKLKNDHDLKVPFTGYAYSNSSIVLNWKAAAKNREQQGLGRMQQLEQQLKTLKFQVTIFL